MADKGFVNKSTMDAIAAAIRTMNGSTSKYLPSAMAAAIKAIKTGGNFVSGSFSISSAGQSQSSYTITHNLGKTPNFALVYAKSQIVEGGTCAATILRSSVSGFVLNYCCVQRYNGTNVNPRAAAYFGPQNITWDSSQVTFAGTYEYGESSTGTAQFYRGKSFGYIVGVV